MVNFGSLLAWPGRSAKSQKLISPPTPAGDRRTCLKMRHRGEDMRFVGPRSGHFGLLDGRGSGRRVGRRRHKTRIEPQPSVRLLQNGRHEHQATTIIDAIIVALCLRPFLDHMKHIHYPVLELNLEDDPSCAPNQSAGTPKAKSAFAVPSSPVSPHRSRRSQSKESFFHPENGF